MNYILNTYGGDTFISVAENAKIIANKKNVTVEFDFNGCICLINSNTNLDWFYRDYSNHWVMGWKEIGPYCVPGYSNDINIEIDRKYKLVEEEIKLQRIEYNKKKNDEKLIFQDKTKGVEMEFSSKENWDLGKSKNMDEYGACIYEYAEGWAKLMQVEAKQKGYTNIDVIVLSAIAESTSLEMGFLGISGYMYGASIQILSQSWKYGEELMKWHNKKYNYDGDGVVNPAVLVINQKL